MILITMYVCFSLFLFLMWAIILIISIWDHFLCSSHVNQKNIKFIANSKTLQINLKGPCDKWRNSKSFLSEVGHRNIIPIRFLCLNFLTS